MEPKKNIRPADAATCLHKKSVTVWSHAPSGLRNQVQALFCNESHPGFGYSTLNLAPFAMNATLALAIQLYILAPFAMNAAPALAVHL